MVRGLKAIILGKRRIHKIDKCELNSLLEEGGLLSQGFSDAEQPGTDHHDLKSQQAKGMQIVLRTLNQQGTSVARISLTALRKLKVFAMHIEPDYWHQSMQSRHENIASELRNACAFTTKGMV